MDTTSKNNHVFFLATAINNLLANDKFICSSVDTLCTLLSKISEEKNTFDITGEGVHLSASLFIPYEIMSPEMLHDVKTIIQHSHCTESVVLDKDPRKYLMRYDVNSNKDDSVGLVNVMCAFFVALKRVFTNLDDVNMSLFEIVLQTSMSERKIPFQVIYSALQEHGYDYTL